MEVGGQRKVLGGEIRRPSGVYSLSKTATSRRGTDATVRHSSHGGVSTMSLVADSTVDGAEDDRIEWLRQTVCSGLSVSQDTFQYLMDKQDCRQAISLFLDQPGCHVLNVCLFNEPATRDGLAVDEGGVRKIRCSNTVPQRIGGEGLASIVYLKEKAHRLSHHEPAVHVIVMQLRDGPLQHLSHLVRHALFPLLGMRQNCKGLTGASVADFSCASEEFVWAVEILDGKLKGQLVLPLPTSIHLEDTHAVARSRNSVRMLERGVLAWIKQIRSSISRDSEEGRSQSTTLWWPSRELNFWAKRAVELEDIMLQLKSKTSQNVMESLRLSHSSYVQTLQRAIDDVSQACVEAKSNTRYLETMRSHVKNLEGSSMALVHHGEVERLGEQQSSGSPLLEVMHTLYMISRSSEFYNTSRRISFFLRLLENVTIAHARFHVFNGGGNETLLTDPDAAAARLETAIQNGLALKRLYSKYEALSLQDCKLRGLDPGQDPWVRPDAASGVKWKRTGLARPTHGQEIINPKLASKLAVTVELTQEEWDSFGIGHLKKDDYVKSGYSYFSPATTVFASLEDFIHRCQDLALVVKLASTFKVLRSIEIGGVNGRRCSVRAQGLYEDIQACIQKLSRVEYSLLTISECTGFEDDFANFCSSLKTLQTRCLSIVQVAYEDSNSLESLANLIINLGPILHLEIFRQLFLDMLERALEQYKSEVGIIRNIFISQEVDRTLLGKADNLPGVTSKICWAKMLLHRLSAANASFHTLSHHFKTLVVEGYEEAVLEARKLRDAMQNFDAVIFSAWAKKVESLPENFLSEPLLRILPPVEGQADCSSGEYHDEEKTSRIEINFEASVLEHAREAKYLSQMSYSLPSRAVYLLQRSEKIRAYLAHLKLIVNLYNDLFANSSEPEWNLVADTLQHLHQLVTEATTVITWQSKRIDNFIVEINCELQTATDIVVQLKKNRGQIQLILEEWGEIPLFRRKKTQIYSLAEFDELHFAHVNSRYQVITAGALQIQTLLEQSMVLCRANWTLTHWLAYVKQVRGSCADWLKEFVKDNLVSLIEELSDDACGASSDQAQHEMSANVAMLELRLELLHARVVDFTPAFKSRDAQKNTVQKSVGQWQESILKAVSHATHDTVDLDYLPEVTSDPEVKRLMTVVDEILERCVQVWSKYKESFAHYSVLWFGSSGEDCTQTVSRRMHADVGLDGVALPDMDAMRCRVDELLRLRELLPKYQDFERKGWVRVDARPLKSAIATLISASLERNTVVLRDYFCTTVDEVEKSLIAAKVEVSKATDFRTGNEYMLSLVLRTVVRTIKDKREAVEATIESLEEVSDFLQIYGFPLTGSRTTQLIALSQLWTDLQKLTLQVKDKYSSMIAAETLALGKRAQNLAHECCNAQERFSSSLIWLPADSSESAYVAIRDMHAETCRMMRDQCEIYELQTLLELSRPMPDSMPVIHDCFLQIFVGKKLWDLHDLVQHTSATWRSIKWTDVRIDELLSVTHEWMLMLPQLAQFDDNKAQHMGVMVESYVRSELFSQVQAEVHFLEASLPLAAKLQHASIRQRHIKKLMSLAGQAFALDHDTCLSDILDLRLPNFADDIHTLLASAEKESDNEDALMLLQERWASVNLIFTEHSDSQQVMLSAQMADTVSSLIELGLELNTIMRSRFGQVFRESNLALQQNLAQGVELIESILAAQSLWCALTDLIEYDSTGILDMLPSLKPIFQAADVDFRELLNLMANYSKMKDLTPLMDMMQTKTGTLLLVLASCEKLVTTWLDQRRALYPRLYFLSNAQLIKVLSEGIRSPRNLMGYLPDIFSGIHSLKFATAVHSSGQEVIAVCNKEGETLVLPREINFQQRHTSMEDWFQLLEAGVKSGMKVAMLHSTRTLGTGMVCDQLVQLGLLQVALLSLKVQWTGLVERALNFVSFGDRLKSLSGLRETSEKNLDTLAQKLRDTTLGMLQRSKYSILACNEVWSRDSLRMLHDALKKIGSEHCAVSPNVFEWQMQMRYYMRHERTKGKSAASTASTLASSATSVEHSAPEETSCRIRMANTSFDYGFECLNLQDPFSFSLSSLRSMICFATVLQQRMVVALGYGSSSLSPCVGKTESFKQMAFASGQSIYIWNTTSHVTRETITKRLLGLCQTGAWGLFENFDASPPELMCYTACLIHSVMSAIKGCRQGHVDGVSVTPNARFGLFASFGSRASSPELPHDLRVLIRPVSVVVPDLRAVTQLLLMSRGFVQFRTLSSQICMHFQLCKNIMTSIENSHEAWWNLRMIRSLIDAAALRKPMLMLDENALIACELRSMNAAFALPHQQDILNLITDSVFGVVGQLGQGSPNVQPMAEKRPEVSSYQQGMNNRHKIFEQRGVQAGPVFLKKLDQLCQVLATRFSTYVIGAPGAGKTEIWQTLAALGMDEKKVVVKTINPSALDIKLLCGGYDENMQWRPGAFSNLVRNAKQNGTKQSSLDFQWIVLDAEVQATWLEMLASTLDSVRHLSLESGEALHLGPEVRILMETCSLRHAMPSATARSALLYISDETVPIQDLVFSWIANLPRDSLKAELQPMFTQKLPHLLAFARNTRVIEFLADVSARSCCISMLHILEGLILAEGDNWSKSSRSVKCLYLFDIAAVWGFGGALAVDRVVDCKQIFSDWWRENMGFFGGQQLPCTGTVFDYTFDPVTLKTMLWKDLISSVKFLPRCSQDEIFVSSPVSVCLHHLLSVTTHACHRLLVVGPDGAGKTSLVQDFLLGLPVHFLSHRVALHHHSTAAETQFQMQQHLQRKAGHVYGPRDDKTIVFFIDDLSAPVVKPTNDAASLLQQHIQYKIWYDLEDLRAREVTHVQYVAAMSNSLGAGTVDSRLLNKFSIVAVQEPNQHEVESIFTSILASYAASFQPEVKHLSGTLGPLTADLHVRLAQYFSGADYPSHCIFTMHNVRSVLNSICCLNPELYSSPEMYLSFWMYEVRREYEDRLEKVPDRHVFNKILGETMHKHLDDGGTVDDMQIFRTLHIPDFDSGFVSPSPWSREQLRQMFSDRLAMHNEMYDALDMVIWDHLLEHLLRTIRVLKRDSGCLVLLGRAGNGRESMVRLASFCCQAHWVAPLFEQIGNSLGANSWDFRCELASCLRTAGVLGRSVTFFVQDNVVASSELLVLIKEIFEGNFLFAPDSQATAQRAIFSTETRAAIIEELRESHAQAALEAGSDNSEAQISSDDHFWKIFVRRAISNLHIVFCLEMCRGLGAMVYFPRLIRKSSINVMPPCLQENRVQIATEKLKIVRFDDEQTSNKAMKYAIAHAMADIYNLASETGLAFSRTSNWEYIIGLPQHTDLANLFVRTLEASLSSIATEVQRLDKCLSRLEHLRSTSDKLTQDSAKWEVDIAEADVVVNELIVTIGQKTRQLNSVREENKGLEDRVSQSSKALNEATLDLGETRMDVIPNFKLACDDLQSSDKVVLGEIKSFSTPPQSIRDIMAVAIILSCPATKAGTWDISWPRVKRTLSSVDRFVIDLLQVDPETVSNDRIEAVKPYLQEAPPQVDKTSTETSEALRMLWNWALSLCAYNQVHNEKIAPLERQIEQLRESLDDASKLKAEGMMQETRINQELKALSAEFEEASSRKSKLQQQARNGRSCHQNAQTLIAKLENNEPTWKRHREELEFKRRNVLGDCLLAATMVVYSGQLSRQYRVKLMSECKQRLEELNIHFSSWYGPENMFLRSGQEFALHQQGLLLLDFGSRNTQALQNAVISENALRSSLFLDPDSIAINWFRRRVAWQIHGKDARTLQLVSRGPAFVRRLKACITAGIAVLCTIVPGEHDALFRSLLQRRIEKRGKDRYLNIGSDSIEYGEGFKLMLRSTSDNLQYFAAGVTTSTSIINFSMDDQEFEDRVLGMVVAAQEHHMYEKRQQALHVFVEQSLQVLHDEIAVIDIIVNMTGDLADTIEVNTISDLKVQVDERAHNLEKTRILLSHCCSHAQPYKDFSQRILGARQQIQQLEALDCSYAFSSQEILHALATVLGREMSDVVSAESTNEMVSAEDELAQPLEHEKMNIDSILSEESPASEDLMGIESNAHNLQQLFAECLAALKLHVSCALRRHHQDAFLVHAFFQDHIERDQIEKDVYEQLVMQDLSLKQKVVLLANHVKPLRSISAELSGFVSEVGAAKPGRSDLSPTSHARHHLSAQWHSWMCSETPETDDLPCGGLEALEKMLLLLILRPERLVIAIRNHLQSNIRDPSQFQDAMNGVQQILHFRNSSSCHLLLPESVIYPWPVPTVLLESNEMETWTDVLVTAVELELLERSHPTMVLSAGSSDFESQFFAAAQSGTWLLVTDVVSKPDVLNFIQRWLDALAFAPLEQDAWVISLASLHACKEETCSADLLNERFRLFIASDLNTQLSFPFLWNQCVRIDCAHAPVGLKSNYDRISKQILDRRSEDPDMDEFSHVLRRALLFHVFLNQLNVSNASHWQLSHRFPQEDIIFAKDRIVEILLADRSICSADGIEGGEKSNRKKLLTDNFHACAYMLSDVVYGGRIIDVWDHRLVHDVASKLFNGDQDARIEVHTLLDLVQTGLMFKTHLPDSHEQLFCLEQHLRSLNDHGKAIRRVYNEAASTYGDSFLDLDLVQDKVADITRCLPLKLIPLGRLIGASTDCTTTRLLGKSSSQTPPLTMLDGPLLHAVLTECKLLNALLETVHSSLRQIDMSLLRHSVLGDKAKALSCVRSLIARQVPAEWIASSFPTAKPLAAWLRDIAERRLPQAWSWATKGARWNALQGVDGCCDLSTLCRPQLFVGSFVLSSLMNSGQSTIACQAQPWNSDVGTCTSLFLGQKEHIMLSASVTTMCEACEISSNAEAADGVWFVHGLSLNGAKWIAESHKSSRDAPGQAAAGHFEQRPVIDKLPIVALRVIDSSTRAQLDTGNPGVVPIYHSHRKSSRLVASLRFEPASPGNWAAAAYIII